MTVIPDNSEKLSPGWKTCQANKNKGLLRVTG